MTSHLLGDQFAEVAKKYKSQLAAETKANTDLKNGMRDMRQQMALMFQLVKTQNVASNRRSAELVAKLESQAHEITRMKLAASHHKNSNHFEY